MKHSSILFRSALLTLALLLSCMPSQLLAWGAMHGSITQSALSVLPAWQQEIVAGQRDALIDLYCMIPDLAQAPANKKELGALVVLPNGDLFSHLPFKTRDKNAYQIGYYFDQSVKAWQANDLDKAARWAGCLLHFLEDSGSPAHTMPGDNQMGLMKDLLPTPEAFKNQPLHGLTEEGKLWVNIAGYRPQLLGTTSDEAVMNLIERYNAMVRNARSQVIPILQGVYRSARNEIDAAQMRAATVDAEVVADALYTILCIAKGRFDPEEVVRLAVVDVSALTPVEVIHQSYFPQHSYFSDPYFGFPLRDGILDEAKQKQPLVLKVAKDGNVSAQEFKHGWGLGTGCRVTYALPGKVHDQFDCWVGLHAALGKEGKVAFRVFADGIAIFESEVMTGESPAQKVSLPVWGVKELSIVTESRNTTRGHNYAVIADPTLRKTSDPQKLKEARDTAPAEPPPLSAEALKNPNKAKVE
ncbi:MAG: NPCBM/NEW2 domain-containing protein [Prosthecobacter sp.]|nr:NPCBM/NEW2 domain-containing protein [Prosthecobacter sp.]